MSWDVLSILPEKMLNKNDKREYFACEIEKISRYGLNEAQDITNLMDVTAKTFNRKFGGIIGGLKQFKKILTPAAESDPVIFQAGLDDGMDLFTQQTIDESKGDIKVMLFSKSKCPDSFEVKRIFKQYGIVSRIIELDYSDGFRGNTLEKNLKKRIGKNVHPAIFIDGEFRGGLRNLMADLKDGKFKEYLDNAKAKYDETKFDGSN